MDLKTVYNMAHAMFPDFQFQECVDIGDRWAFYFAPAGSLDDPGIPYITVHKQTGEVKYLTIPPMENLELLKKGKRVKLKFNN